MPNPHVGQLSLSSPGLPTFADLRAFVDYCNDRKIDPGAAISSRIGDDGLTVLTVEAIVPVNT